MVTGSGRPAAARTHSRRRSRLATGAGAVLCFWLAYILTRPLGANIGDYLASPTEEGGLGLGTLATSVLFLGAIVVIVAYLTVTKKDRTELTPAS